MEKERAKKHSELREREREMSFSSSSAAKATCSDPIAFEILSRLPAKSVMRFKSVCKQWLALASDPFFLAAHTRCNPPTFSGFLVQDAVKGPLTSFSAAGGASPALPDPSLSSLNRRFAASDDILVWQSCNGLLLCRTRSPWPPGLLILNPTTMQYREIPDPPTGLYPFKYQFMLAFDPSTSFQYRIACFSCNITPTAFDPTASQLHVEIYSSDTGAWELSRSGETLPGCTPLHKGVYWNGALNWISQNDLFISFDLEQQVVRTTPMPPWHHHKPILYFGESRGHLYTIGIAADIGCCDFDWLHFHVFEMGKDDLSWSLIYNVDLNGVRDPGIISTPPDENLLRILPDSGFFAFPVFFARGGEGEDDKLYLSNSDKIVCYNLADRTSRKIFALNSCIRMNLPASHVIIQFFPFAHSFFSP
ncbi:F-box protein At5g07610-like [Phoenix dactylifera]|uniref:F-box protein At5g07610-like n=1 Tax=Phoenix dactylifera TaxID=42345 RepID=A0A8B7CCT3_PHODC|nr:F-box protein At5g07610-like [Phoenix dactylifera]